jgi:phospholipase A1/A2
MELFFSGISYISWNLKIQTLQSSRHLQISLEVDSKLFFSNLATRIHTMVNFKYRNFFGKSLAIIAGILIAAPAIAEGGDAVGDEFVNTEVVSTDHTDTTIHKTITRPTQTKKPVSSNHTKPHQDKATTTQSTTASTPDVNTRQTARPVNPDDTLEDKSVIDARYTKESLIPAKFAISFYRPTYVIPYYYTFSPYNSIYQGNTPDGESLKHNEIKYQFSFKVPLWKSIFSTPTSLYFAYTQMSYWQAYNKYAFFRSTDYEPEVFLQTDFNKHMFANWDFNIVSLGLVHQSNGFGNSLERSWNRAYLMAAISNPYLMIAVKPWIIFRDSTYERQNPDMAKYLGYEQVVIALKYKASVISLETRNFAHGFHRSGNTLSMSFPVTKYLNGYVQVFSGYGQSLIEYNHRTNSVGVGISLSNWV